MIIEDIPISAVKPYEKNPRKNDKEETEGNIASVEIDKQLNTNEE